MQRSRRSALPSGWESRHSECSSREGHLPFRPLTAHLMAQSDEGEQLEANQVESGSTAISIPSKISVWQGKQQCRRLLSWCPFRCDKLACCGRGGEECGGLVGKALLLG